VHRRIDIEASGATPIVNRDEKRNHGLERLWGRALSSPDRCIWLLIAAHILVWTAYPVIANSSAALHHDMTEAWAWGKELQLGYYKHPPLYSWIAGLWFEICPRKDWCFYLLSAVNVAAGLLGVWFLAGRFLSGWARFAAVAFLEFIPFYNFRAIYYNANSILLSLWPWAAYFFVRALQSGRALDGFLFGIFAAAALLAKYYSALLLLSCLVASLVHPNSGSVYRARAPYVAAATCAALLIPHVWWGFEHAWPTMDYATRHIGYPYSRLVISAAITGIAYIASHALFVVALLICFRDQTIAILKRSASNLARRKNHWLGILAFGPLFLTLLCGVLATTKVSITFLIPAAFMTPIAVLTLSCVEFNTSQLVALAQFAKWCIIVILAVSPALAVVTFVLPQDATKEPRRELGIEATRLWREAFGTRLAVAAGSQAYGHGLAFYSPDGPSVFSETRYTLSPWITPQRIAREGLLVACLQNDLACLQAAENFVTPDTRRVKLTLTHGFLGLQTAPAMFELIMVPPRAARD
jgi:hypothetical protein